jgi:hypothetical protein
VTASVHSVAPMALSRLPLRMTSAVPTPRLRHSGETKANASRRPTNRAGVWLNWLLCRTAVRSSPGLPGIEIDPYGQGARAHSHGGLQAEAAPAAGATKDAGALLGVVVVQDVRGSGTPARARQAAPDAHPGVGLDVLHVLGAAALLRDDPEGVALKAIADRSHAQPSSASARRLQESVAGRRDPQRERELVERVDHRSLEPVGDPMSRSALVRARGWRIGRDAPPGFVFLPSSSPG